MGKTFKDVLPSIRKPHYYINGQCNNSHHNEHAYPYACFENGLNGGTAAVEKRYQEKMIV